MKINIIMSVFNSISTLEKCLESIYSQSYREWHMYIVDDGCNDGSEILLSSIKDPRVTVIRNNRNMGLAYSLNKAINLCDSKFIARADSDDIQLKTRLEEQLNYFEKNPHIDLLYTSAYMRISNGYKKINTPTTHEEISEKLKKRNCIIHPTIMVKSNFFKKYGFYDETFLRAQDYELWLRALGKGANFMALNKPLIYYNTNYNFPLKTIFRHTYNRLRIFAKYQNFNSINYLIFDILHPYFLKFISLFKFI